MSKELKKSRQGKRFFGRRLRTISPYMAMTPYIMPKRNDALVNYADSFDITTAERFIRAKRVEGMKGLGLLHVMVAGYVRAVSQCPQLNRFITGQRVYARTNIEVVMSVKREMTIDAEETSIKVVFEPSDTLSDVYYKMKKEIDAVKGGDDNSTDGVARAFMSLPRGILRFAMSIVRFMDYYGLLPEALLKASPFHGSMIVTDMGSLGIPPVNHHIYNLGNLPVFLSFGAKYRKYEMGKSGAVAEKKYIDYCVVIDERICDGLTYAKGVKLMKSYFKDPSQLEAPPEQVFEDII